MQLALKQLNYDFFYAIFGSFQSRQAELQGYEFQVGLGASAKFYRVYFEFMQLTGDHPQVHTNTGRMNNACHVCKS